MDNDYNIANYIQHHHRITATNSPDMQNHQEVQALQNAINYASLPPGFLQQMFPPTNQLHALTAHYQHFMHQSTAPGLFQQYMVQHQLAHRLMQVAQTSQSPPSMHFAQAIKPPLMPFLPYMVNGSPPGLSMPITNLSPSVSPSSTPPMECPATSTSSTAAADSPPYTNQNNNYQPHIKLEPAHIHMSESSPDRSAATGIRVSVKRLQRKTKSTERKVSKSRSPTAAAVEPLSPPTSGSSTAESSPAAASTSTASSNGSSSSSSVSPPMPFLLSPDEVDVVLSCPAPQSASAVPEPHLMPASEAAAAVPALSSPASRRGQSGPAKTFTCHECNRSFGYKHVLQNHERTHTGEKPFACQECNKRFTRDHHLKTHMRLHTGEKPYECEFCIRKFVQVANLRRHMRVHTGEKPYHCVVCKMFFADSNQLKSHRYKHITELPFECEFCANRFEDKDQLEQHHCKKGGSPSAKGARVRAAKTTESRRAGKPRASKALAERLSSVCDGPVIRAVEAFPVAGVQRMAFCESVDESVAMDVDNSDGVQTEPQDLTMPSKRSSCGSSDSDPDEPLENEE